MSIFKLRVLKKYDIDTIRKFTTTSDAVYMDNKIPTNVKPWREIPGPTTLPVIGQLHNFLPGGSLYQNSETDVWKNLNDKYGPIVRLQCVFMPRMVVLFDPEIMSQVYHAENILPNRPGMAPFDYYRRVKKPIKSGIIGLVTSQGKDWKDFRSIVNPIMLRSNVLKRYSDDLKEIAKEMVIRLRILRDENNRVPQFLEEMRKLSLESVALIALGARVNIIGSNSEDNHIAQELMNNSAKINGGLNLLDVGLWKYLPTKSFRTAIKSLECMDIIARQYVQSAVEIKNDDTKEKSILQKLYDINEDVAVVMATDMISAGFDTVSISLYNLAYLLAANPKKQEQLREKLGTDEQDRYVKAFIKEAMRMKPVAGFNGRRTTKDHNILGYHVPKDVLVIPCHYLLTNSDDQFPRAQEFLPERWLVDKDHPLYYGNAHPFAFMPFGFGTRSCIGRRIAELELSVFLTHMVENFEFEWCGPPPKVVTKLLFFPEGTGLIVKDRDVQSKLN